VSRQILGKKQYDELNFLDGLCHCTWEYKIFALHKLTHDYEMTYREFKSFLEKIAREK